MNFDGRSALFERAIEAHTSEQLLRTERLEVTLKRTIHFADPPSSDGKAEPAQIDQIVCQGGATSKIAPSTKRGSRRSTACRPWTWRSTTPRAASTRHGPGWVSSVRLGMPTGMGAAGVAGGRTPGTKPVAPDAEKQPPADENKLSYLNVNFARAITGNLHTRELTFTDQVKTVYGPVANWQGQLDAEKPETLPPEAVLLSCDALTVRETPDRMPAQENRSERGYLELEAAGNTLVEGSGFTARAHRLTFAEKKSLLVLEGDGMSDAQLFRQPVLGGPTSQASARRILFWQATNRVEIDDARFFDFGQLLGGSNKQPAAGDAAADPKAKPKVATPKRNPPARGGAAAVH